MQTHPTSPHAGVKYPLAWINAVKAKSRPGTRWRVLLDAAAYVPTQPLDLSAARPDFVSMSFYKIFGYPTGLGALLVRVEAAGELKKVRGAARTSVCACGGGGAVESSLVGRCSLLRRWGVGGLRKANAHPPHRPPTFQTRPPEPTHLLKPPHLPISSTPTPTTTPNPTKPTQTHPPPKPTPHAPPDVLGRRLRCPGHLGRRLPRPKVPPLRAARGRHRQLPGHRGAAARVQPDERPGGDHGDPGGCKGGGL
jgi:hypothetical protein